MTKEAGELLSVGEIIPFKRGDDIVNSTLIEIVQLPVDPKDRDSLIKTTMMRLSHNDNVAFMPGENLSDHPKFAQRVDKSVLYIFEYSE